MNLTPRWNVFLGTGLLLIAGWLMLNPIAAEGEEGDNAEVLLRTASPSAIVPDSLQREARAAAERGYRWLLSQQREDGGWSNPDFPALTGLPVWALARGGYAEHAAVSNAVDFILQYVHEDGSIWRDPTEERRGGGLMTYNTAVSMVALHEVNRPELQDTVQAARRFMVGQQHLGDDEYFGGFGYDAETDRAYADLSNSLMAFEAMRLTEGPTDDDLEVRVDLDWDAAIAFVEQLQNPDGGFIYKPGHSMAGAETNEVGEVTFRSYGSMTYAGLLSLIYADVHREDPRVQSAFDWSRRHWSLEENPGMGAQGLFYFYNVLSKALAAYGHTTFETEDGQIVNWRSALIQTLLNHQRIDPETGAGYWVNDAGRWFEADPVLVTSYSLIALQLALGGS